MNYEQILQDIAQRKFKPVYLLQGNEPYFIDKITEAFEQKVLTEEQKPFNLNILYGKDCDAGTVDNTARRFPMGSKYNLVIVKEAQLLNQIDQLVFYVSGPLASSILVICYKYKELDKRKKLFKAFNKNGVVFTSNRLYDDKIPRWIINYLNKKNIHIEPGAAMILNEYIGNDLSRISHELDKLLITLPGSTPKITPDHIEQNIGISKEYNNFELMKAMARKNIAKTYRIINYLGDNQKQNHINLTISSLFYFFSKVLALHFMKDRSTRKVASALQINSYFVPDYLQAIQNYSRKKVVEIISILREYDLRSKGVNRVGTSESDLLKEMTYRILH